MNNKKSLQVALGFLDEAARGLSRSGDHFPVSVQIRAAIGRIEEVLQALPEEQRADQRMVRKVGC